jgi:hypothetical protein
VPAITSKHSPPPTKASTNAWGASAQGGGPTIGETWFDPDELRTLATAKHGSPGANCEECGTWRWLPLLSDETPRYRLLSLPEDVHVAASPEWFGDGWKAFRQIIVSRALTEVLVSASPRDFRIREIQQ